MKVWYGGVDVCVVMWDVVEMMERVEREIA